jgi:hypothetical protein
MKRPQLEHIIRASADIADDDEIVVISKSTLLARLTETALSPDHRATLKLRIESDFSQAGQR